MIEKRKLSDIAKIDLSSIDKKTKPLEQSVKLCNFTDIYYNWAITKTKAEKFMVATASANDIKRFALKKGQVAITKDSETRDDIGMAAYIADDVENTVLGYHCALITPDEQILNGKFLNAYLNSQFGRKNFSNQASGSGQRYTLTENAIGAVQIPLPDISTQNKIGNVFSVLDRKIENNFVLLSNLQSLAKLIYDYWFLQFDFPNETGNPYRSSGGKMVWEGKIKREIPKNWIVTTLGELAEYVNLKVPNDQLTPDTYVGNDNLLNEMGGKCKSEYVPVEGVSTEFKIGDILLGNIRPYFHKIWYADCGGGCSADVLCIRARVGIPSEFLYAVLARSNFFDYVMAGSKGSKMPRGDKAHIMKYPVIFNKEIANKFANIISGPYQLSQRLRRENIELLSLRDFLIPLLIRGRVTFKEEV